ncbi:13662_t:CDS:2 [Cetraspora pellucida]|uniref:13662_t:CDS:1 n=1 Tax=Cetraspora pellucida TaxID=1433469 RepID=A0A9N9E8E5_9GLOM|nr:13662_t:CDS:2 [Cetraspora pellucida]
MRTLTEEKKQRRWANNLCLYSGEPGHIARSCPKKGVANHRIVAAEAMPERSGKDSGASACFLDYILAHKYNLPVKKKNILLSVEVIDGRKISSGAVLYETEPLLLCYQNHCEEITFNLIQMPHHQAILGLPWLVLHNSNINWHERTLQFLDEGCSAHGWHSFTMYPATNISTSEKVFWAQIFHVAPVNGKVETATPTLPIKYNNFSDVFDKKEADRLSEHRPYDCAIDLAPGKQPPWGPIYKLSELELETLKKYIEENLDKGYIRHSSPGAALSFRSVCKTGEVRV